MKKDMIFFSESGITSTSANHIANLAKEAYESIESALENIQFYETTVDTTNNHLVLEEGNIDSEVDKIPSMIDRQALLKSLIAWLREAIKARNSLNQELSKITMEEWANTNSITLPQKPEYPPILTEDEYYGSLDIKQRNLYYTLETKCATLGKYIHPNGSISKARKDMKIKSSKPHSVSGRGRDITVYNYRITVTPDKVEDLFFTLQQKHRELQANLNSIRFECEKAIEESNTKANAEYTVAMHKYTSEVSAIGAEYKKWIQAKQVKIGKLKIVIPDHLKSIYEEISALGKK